jgi:hypothetical protein
LEKENPTAAFIGFPLNLLTVIAFDGGQLHPNNPKAKLDGLECIHPTSVENSISSEAFGKGRNIPLMP